MFAKYSHLSTLHSVALSTLHTLERLRAPGIAPVPPTDDDEDAPETLRSPTHYAAVDAVLDAYQDDAPDTIRSAPRVRICLACEVCK